MHLVVIHGPPAVGKKTIALCLGQKTGYRVMDNHLTIDLALGLTSFGSDFFYRLIQKLRFVILQELVKQREIHGLIWTTGLPKQKKITDFYKKVDRFIEKNGGCTSYVHIICTPEEQRKRVMESSRKASQKIKTIIELEKIMKKINFSPGHFGKNRISIENTNSEPEEVVKKVIQLLDISELKC